MVIPIIQDGPTNFSSSLNNVLNNWGDQFIVENWPKNETTYLQRLFDRNKELPPIGFAVMVAEKGFILYYRQVLPSSISLAFQAITEAVSINPTIIRTTMKSETQDIDFNDTHKSLLIFLLVAAGFIFHLFVIIFYIIKRENKIFYLYK